MIGFSNKTNLFGHNIAIMYPRGVQYLRQYIHPSVPLFKSQYAC